MSLASELLKTFGVGVAEAIAKFLLEGKDLDKITAADLMRDLRSQAEVNRITRMANVERAKKAAGL